MQLDVGNEPDLSKQKIPCPSDMNFPQSVASNKHNEMEMFRFLAMILTGI